MTTCSPKDRRNYVVSPHRVKAWNIAVVAAEQTHRMLRSERIDSFKFIYSKQESDVVTDCSFRSTRASSSTPKKNVYQQRKYSKQKRSSNDESPVDSDTTTEKKRQRRVSKLDLSTSMEDGESNDQSSLLNGSRSIRSPRCRLPSGNISTPATPATSPQRRHSLNAISPSSCPRPRRACTAASPSASSPVVKQQGTTLSAWSDLSLILTLWLPLSGIRL